MVPSHHDRSYFSVPKQPDELIQLAEVVEHIIIDEGQEIPTTWLTRLADKIAINVGVTLFYDLNQLGGNIPNGDSKRYRHRLTDWKMMLAGFPRMQKFQLAVNYRNAREIAECYFDLLSEALPAKPIADVPVFEAGEVIYRKINFHDANDVIAGVLHRLLREHSPHEIGIVSLDQSAHSLLRALAKRKFRVGDDPKQDTVVVTTPSKIRGHERQVMIVTTENYRGLRRNFGVAIDAYIAMSRAVKRLIVLEVVTR